MSTTGMTLHQLPDPQEAADVYDDGYLRVEHQNYYAACRGQILKLRGPSF